jgi:hypothetical protein
MDNFNFKQYLYESRVGMYSRARLNENALMDSEALGKEIAKQHPELLDFKLNRETKKYQDAIFKYAGELLHGAGVSLQTVRGLAYDEDWAMELVSAVGDELEHGEDVDYSNREDMPGFSGTWDALNKISIREVSPSTLGAPQAAADAEMQQQDDQNGSEVDNASMGVVAEDEVNPIEAAYGNVGSADKVAPAETGISKYLDILHNYDWFHHFADDPRAWRKGQSDKESLKSLYSSLTPNEKQQAIDTFTDKYLSIHDPKEFPNAANNVKYITTDTFKGAI